MPAHGIHLYDFVHGADLSASAGKISYDIIYGVDFFVFGISFLLMYFYGRMMEPVGSAARFLYLCLYLLSMPFTATYDSLTMTVLIDLLMPIIVNFIYCKWVCHPIRWA